MGLRNFWIEATVDGKKVPISFGGRAFELTVRVNDGGESKEALHVEGLVVSADPDRLYVEAHIDPGYWSPGHPALSVAANKRKREGAEK